MKLIVDAFGGDNAPLEIIKGCELAVKEYGYDARRGQQFAGINGDADVVGLHSIHIEVKRVEKLNIDEALQQSIRDARDAEIPVVMHRKNRTEWKITMLFDDWINMYKAWEKDKK